MQKRLESGGTCVSECYVRFRCFCGNKVVFRGRIYRYSRKNLAFIHNVTIYDAFYAALAKAVGFTLITADAKFYRKTKNLSFVKFIDGIDTVQ